MWPVLLADDSQFLAGKEGAGPSFSPLQRAVPIRQKKLDPLL